MSSTITPVDDSSNHQYQSSSSYKPLSTSTHLITIPFPSPSQPTNLIAHLTLFRGNSLLLWCGEASSSSAEEGDLLKPNHTAHLTTEWAVAMTASRSMTTTTTTTTNSTSLYRTNADYAQPMSARLAKRFSLSQIFLSLSLPQSILESLKGPYAGPEGSRSLMLIEGGLKEILQETFGSV